MDCRKLFEVLKIFKEKEKVSEHKNQRKTFMGIAFKAIQTAYTRCNDPREAYISRYSKGFQAWALKKDIQTIDLKADFLPFKYTFTAWNDITEC